MALNIVEFSGQIKHGFARPSLFQVEVANPADPSGDNILPFFCKTSTIPEATLNSIDIPYMGRTIKVAGNTREYPDWTVTISNDEDFIVRNALEAWSHYINTAEGNLRNFGSNSPSEYKSLARVKQYSKTGEIIREYQFVGIWPLTIGAIDLAWDSTEVQEFDVTWVYDYWQVVDGTTGAAGGNNL